jgi:hypothetical protein
LIIDARLKPWFPPVTDPDPEIAEMVEQKYGRIFAKYKG